MGSCKAISIVARWKRKPENPGWQSLLVLKSVLAAIALLLVCETSFAQNMSGIAIGNSADKLRELGAELVAKQDMGPHTAIRLKLPDGNELSATFSRATGKIVYLESEWSGERSGSFSDFPGMLFGKTTLDQIRERLGNNGMRYLEGPGEVSDDDGIATFNSYDLATSNTVVTFVSRISRARMESLIKANGPNFEPNFGAEFKLAGLIWADKSYLEGIWGEERITDQPYTPIEWR